MTTPWRNEAGEPGGGRRADVAARPREVEVDAEAVAVKAAAPASDGPRAAWEDFRTFVEITHEWMWSIDLEGRRTYSNPAVERILGYSPDELLGRSAFELMCEADRERVASLWPVWVSQRRGWSNVVLRWRHKLGGVRYLESSGVPIVDGRGDVVGFQGADRDVTERIRREAALRRSEERYRTLVSERQRVANEVRRLNGELEDRVRRRTEELAAANDDLESFTYSVSHDLRAPLRAIDGFSKILLQDYPDRLDQAGKDYLKRIRLATVRMARLIDDLLMLGRVARSDMRRERVNLTALARLIVEDLRRSDPGRAVDVNIAPGLSAWGDKRLFRLVLENLLGNAWKFTAHRERALIELARHPGSEGAVFTVRDNGAGFDMTYAHKLFAPFQRLHSEKEFPGTGIGLATVRRIIERHGGRVWADGAVDRGASIYFTVPDAEPETAGTTAPT